MVGGEEQDLNIYIHTNYNNKHENKNTQKRGFCAESRIELIYVLYILSVYHRGVIKRDVLCKWRRGFYFILLDL